MKKPAVFTPVPVAVQRKQHQAALRAAKALPPLPKGGPGKAILRRRPLTAKKRGWSPDETVECCSARAVAESLALALGVAVADEDVLRLYWRTASDPDAGASIEATLTAARDFWGPGLAAPCHGVDQAGDILILGLDLPGGQTHAVAVGPDGAWWSWRQRCSPADFPGAIIDEARAVSWQL